MFLGLTLFELKLTVLKLNVNLIFQGIQENISQHNSVLCQIRDLGCRLMNGASPQDFTVISNQLSILQASYEALQTQVSRTCQILGHKLAKVKTIVIIFIIDDDMLMY